MELTHKEKKLILMSLLWISSTDFCLDDFDMDGTLDLAKKLSKEFDMNDLEDTELYFWGGSFEDEKMVDEIKKHFKIRHEK